MVTAPYSLREDYWELFELEQDDIEFIYNYLLEREVPLTTQELVTALVGERVRREKTNLEKQRNASGDKYLPKNSYTLEQKLVFPALDWKSGTVVGIRPGRNPDIGPFEVIQVKFDHDEQREFASGIEDHILNQPAKVSAENMDLDPELVMENYHEDLILTLDDELSKNADIVRIAGRWFPRALLLDVNLGHLNLAEAVLDIAGGGPLPTTSLIEQVELTSDINPSLIEFSLDLALQEDVRFDEVGPSGEVLWFLKRLEPAEVQEPPVLLRYSGIEYDRNLLSPEMLALEKDIADELSPIKESLTRDAAVSINLIYPHWRSGTLPISWRTRNIFPSAYEAPRIRFTFVDEESGRKFPAWVVLEKHYVYGMAEWYERHGLIPGSTIHLQRSRNPGEVLIRTDSRKSSREWIRTVLVGSDGGVVFAMLKQVVNADFDERMALVVPDTAALDEIWAQMAKDRPPFERIVVNIMRELTKLNPQGNVHAAELYAGVNVIRRCPPGPLLAMLASRPWFVHVGDLHYRYNDSEH